MYASVVIVTCCCSRPVGPAGPLRGRAPAGGRHRGHQGQPGRGWHPVLVGGVRRLGGAYFTLWRSTGSFTRTPRRARLHRPGRGDLGPLEPDRRDLRRAVLRLHRTTCSDAAHHRQDPGPAHGRLPYLATIIAVAGFVGRVRPPAADGSPTSRADAWTDFDWAALDGGRPWTCPPRAYAPYSPLPGGGGGPRGRRPRWCGCNVENASYGVVLCAECALVASLHTTGGGLLDALRVRRRRRRGDHALRALPPAAVRVRRPGHAAHDHAGNARPMDQVLPDAFGPDDLEETR